ncbi:MAG: RagB/SusD family nutrient uptake outer membrane protein [Flavicella sp.]
MKNYRILLMLFLALVTSRCDLKEESPFLVNETVFSSTSNMEAALDGVYEAMAGYNYIGSQFFYLNNMGSGFGVTRRGGNTNTNADNTTLCALKPTSAATYLENTWFGMYIVIERANTIISFGETYDNPVNDDQIKSNEIVGQALFLRAFSYFNLVRFWGDVPLRLTPIDATTVQVGKTSQKIIYDQIIQDTQTATDLMSGALGVGYPKGDAAYMLLAKVYMTLATAPSELQNSEFNYWQLAHDAAIRLYQKYELVSEYADLFDEATGDNTSESIFELQYTLGASSDFKRAYTPNNYTKAATFGFLKVNADVYDLHEATYPGDPRLATIYISEYTQQHNGKPLKAYPANPQRRTFNSGFPYLRKLGSKNPDNTITEGNRNVILYRYADLLIMLSEITNELQNGDALQYVNEVLQRNGLFPHQGYLGTQDEFRMAIMKEYQFELLMEGQDWFNNRRRGYDYFMNAVVTPHNEYSKFNSDVDVTLDTNEATIMKLPFPASEINMNQEISD